MLVNRPKDAPLKETIRGDNNWLTRKGGGCSKVISASATDRREWVASVAEKCVNVRRPVLVHCRPTREDDSEINKEPNPLDLSFGKSFPFPPKDP